MLVRLRKEADHVVVVEGVEHHLARASLPDEMSVPEEPQLMRHGRFTEAEHLRDVSDAEFAAREHVQDADAGGIAQHLEGVGEGVDKLGVEELAVDFLNI